MAGGEHGSIRLSVENYPATAVERAMKIEEVLLDFWPTLASESDTFAHVHRTPPHWVLPSHIRSRYRRDRLRRKIVPFHWGSGTFLTRAGTLCAMVLRQPLREQNRPANSIRRLH